MDDTWLEIDRKFYIISQKSYIRKQKSFGLNHKEER